MAKQKEIPIGELETEFAKVVSTLTYEYSPFYASVVMQCARIYTYEIPTLAVAVTEQVLLLVNPDFFMGRQKVKDLKTGKIIEVGCKSIQERIGVVEHELLHLIFYHLSRGQRHMNKDESNKAADAVVNQNILAKLPGDPILVEKFGMPKDKDFDWYYREFMKKQQGGQGKQSKKGKANQQQPGQGQGQGQPQQGDGDGEGDDQANAQNGRGSHSTWEESDQDGDGDGEGNGNEALKKAGIDEGGLSDSAKEAIVCDVMRKAAEKEGEEGLSKLPGSVASQVKEMIKEKKATQPWNVLLRRYVGSHGSSHLKSSRKYSSRRYKDPHTGRPSRPGLRIHRSKRILVGIDTSGSMSKEEFDLIAGEIRLMYRFNKDIHIAECDTKLHRVYPYRGKMEFVQGRGGTELSPIRRLYEDEKNGYDLCICLTDGYIGDIGPRPRKPWMWVLTHQSVEPCDWGAFVRLPDPNTVGAAA